MPRSREKPKAERRVLAEQRGHRGETLAAWLLRAKLYRVIAQRFKTPVGEIDLVAEQGRTVVFIEVKWRRRGAPEAEALSAVNRKRIVRAAQYWLSRHPEQAERDLRFDVIFLAPGRWPRHLVNAFPAF
jgi:putative endonuclease